MTEETAQDPMNDPEIQGEVIATGTAVNTVLSNLGEVLERAMVDAIHLCHSRGVTDPESILRAKMLAMNEAKSAYETHAASLTG